MSEIVIHNPQKNTDLRRRHLEGNDPWFTAMSTRFEQEHIGPKNYPKVAVMYAGDGAVAKYLVGQLRWPAENVYCIDIAESEKPLVKNVNWLYWDINQLAYAIDDQEELPGEVINYIDGFDVMIYSSADTTEWTAEKVAFLLVRKGGYVYGPWDNYFIALDDSD